MKAAFLHPLDVKHPGWYWFRPNDGSPHELTGRDITVVSVILDGDNRTNIGLFPKGRQFCRMMGGLWFGPLECPFK